MGNMIGEYNAHCQLKDLFVDLVKQPISYYLLYYRYLSCYSC